MSLPENSASASGVQPNTEAPIRDEAPVLTIIPFESDSRILVLTYAADWHSEGQFCNVSKQFRDQWSPQNEALFGKSTGAVFDALASGYEIFREDQFSGLLFFWSLFLKHRIPFAISGASESVLSIIEMMRVPFLLADSLAAAAGICNEIGPSMRNKDEESFQRIWVEHMATFRGRNGRIAPRREASPAQIAEWYLRPRMGEGGSSRNDP